MLLMLQMRLKKIDMLMIATPFLKMLRNH
uniref:Uncharacterized protein n=1 Tax=Arundo donax TaxID=35708 RepID=A0A0A9HLK6_ARUDO